MKFIKTKNLVQNTINDNSGFDLGQRMRRGLQTRYKDASSQTEEQSSPQEYAEGIVADTEEYIAKRLVDTAAPSSNKIRTGIPNDNQWYTTGIPDGNQMTTNRISIERSQQAFIKNRQAEMITVNSRKGSAPHSSNNKLLYRASERIKTSIQKSLKAVSDSAEDLKVILTAESVIPIIIIVLICSVGLAIGSSFGVSYSGGSAAIVEVAKTQIGNVGGEPYWSWYGFTNRVEWCSCFVSWCANECGYIEAGTVPMHADPQVAVNWYKAYGKWLPGNTEPTTGMLIFFDWDNKGRSGDQDGYADHIGIVEKVEDSWVWTIEGNTADSVARRRYEIGHYEIMGYGK